MTDADRQSPPSPRRGIAFSSAMQTHFAKVRRPAYWCRLFANPVLLLAMCGAAAGVTLLKSQAHGPKFAQQRSSMERESVWTGELRLRASLPQERPVAAIAWSPDGERLAVADRNGNGMAVWSHSIAFMPSGKTLVTESLQGVDEIRAGTQTTSLTILDAYSGEVMRALDGPIPGKPNSARLFTISTDGRYIAMVPSGQPNLVTIYETDSYAVVERFEWPVETMSFSPKGHLLALGGWDGSVLLHGIDDSELNKEFVAQPSGITALAYTPNGSTLLAGMISVLWGSPPKDLSPEKAEEIDRHKIRAFDVQTGDLVGSINATLPRIFSISFHPNGKVFATACEIEAYVFDASTFTMLRKLPVSSGFVPSVAFSPDGKLIAVAESQSVSVYRPAELAE